MRCNSVYWISFGFFWAIVYCHNQTIAKAGENCTKAADNNSNYESILRKQLSMNPRTWQALLKHGITTQTSVRLDFFYVSPNEEASRCLVSVLKAETDYEIAPPARSYDDRGWLVSGSTRATRISPDILDKWVAWMVFAGKRGGGSVFDGWGTETRK